MGVDNPHFLGPVIVAEKDRPVRITFYNLLPKGQGGDLFLPADSTIMGSGFAPEEWRSFDILSDGNGTVTDEIRNPVCSQYPKDAESVLLTTALLCISMAV